MALAGFNKDDIEIELADSELTVRSKKREDSNKDVNLIHQGISIDHLIESLPCQKKFWLKCRNENGMLIIKLENLFQKIKNQN